jgi:addiction module RelB/DinJ family antitoxin
MNTALLSVRTDKKTKKEIVEFANSLGLSTSAFVTVVLKQAVRERRVVLEKPLEPTPYLEKIMEEVEKDTKAGRNIVGPFDTAEEMIASLEK